MSKIVHMSSVHPALDVRIMLKECVSLAKAGYDVTFVVPHDKDEQYDGVTIKSIKRSQSGRLFRVFVTTWRVFLEAWRQNADLYHFHDPELMPIGILLRLKGAKVVYDVHEDYPKQTMSKRYIPIYFRYSVASSLRLLEWFGARFVFSAIATATPAISARFPQHKTVTIQNFPKLDEINPTNQPIPFSQRDKKVVYVGGLAKVRGIVESVEAIGKVEQKGAQLVIAGAITEDPPKHELEDLTGWSSVETLGWVDRPKVVELLRSSYAGLVLFHPEPNHINAQPNKMFEYMAAGLPVIVSNFPLWREIVDKNKCGLLVDPMKPEAIAKAMDWIFSHPHKAEEMGRRGVKAVQKIYNWPMEEDKLVKLYKRLLA